MNLIIYWLITELVIFMKCEELQVRLKKLAVAAEKKAYEELVKDITPRKSVEEPFSSYKDQIGFGQFFFAIT